jgi:uncharacterized protein (TIGR03083 family)
MTHDATTRALAAEAEALQAAMTGLTEQESSLLSPCAPWTVGELLCHVVIGAGRVAQALAEPKPADLTLAAGTEVASTGVGSTGVGSTVDYYRHDVRFSAAVDADRIETARALAKELGGPEQMSLELERRCRETNSLLAAAPADRTIRTRHGDRMLLTDFAGTRVVELAVHGLDLAIGLGRPPWLTDEAADVLENLWLPIGCAEQLRQQLGCDRAGLIARLTGRAAASPAERKLLADAGARDLALS